MEGKSHGVQTDTVSSLVGAQTFLDLLPEAQVPSVGNYSSAQDHFRLCAAEIEVALLLFTQGAVSHLIYAADRLRVVLVQQTGPLPEHPLLFPRK